MSDAKCHRETLHTPSTVLMITFSLSAASGWFNDCSLSVSLPPSLSLARARFHSAQPLGPAASACYLQARELRLGVRVNIVCVAYCVRSTLCV